MAGDFAVWVPTLRTGSGWMADDARAVTSAGSDGAGSAADGGGSANAGPLVGASNRLSSAISRACGNLSEALTGASETLTGNGNRYEADDTSAASGLDAVDFAGQGSW